MVTKLVKIEDITVDHAVNVSRPEGLDLTVLAQYAEALDNGANFPPIVVFDDGAKKWLASGFHRLEAAKSIGWAEFEAEVRTGDKTQAIRHACSDNAEHGKQRTNQGKRQQVEQMLKLEGEWSDRQIARWCQVSNRFVSNLRNLTVNVHSENQENYTGCSSSINQQRTYVTKHGTVSTMRIGNIGGQPITLAAAPTAVNPPDWYQSSESDDWWTPQWLFNRLDREFNFELDVCASPDNATCQNYYSRQDDALQQEWTGICWMNPPYGRTGDQSIYDWMAKAHQSAQQGATVVCLVPARTDTEWWWHHCLEAEIRFLKGRLQFENSDSKAPFPSAVIIFRPGLPDTGQVKWWKVDK
mgnify:CR=1 FL=1